MNKNSDLVERAKKEASFAPANGTVRDLYFEMICRIEALEKEERTCLWTEEDHGDYWESDCCECWTYDSDGPKENRVRYCHGCGGKIIFKDFEVDDDDD